MVQYMSLPGACSLDIQSDSVSRFERGLSTGETSPTESKKRKRTLPDRLRNAVLDRSLPHSILDLQEEPSSKKSCPKSYWEGRVQTVAKGTSTEVNETLTVESEASTVAAVTEISPRDVPGKISGIRITSFFEAKGLEYSAMPKVLKPSVKDKLSEVWEKHEGEYDYNFESSEVKKIVRCLDSMKDDASDDYASSVEIKFVDRVMGYGVCANRKILKNEVIGIYSGIVDFTHPKRKRQREGKDLNEYLFEFPDTPFDRFGTDGAKTGNFTRFINHAEPKLANAATVEFFYKGMCYVVFVAEKAIQKGEQITYDYGASYWEKNDKTPK